MSFITKNRLKNWLLIFLLVTNVATISTILYHRWSFHRHEREGSPQQKMKDFINNDLGLSTEQKAAIEKEHTASDSTREILFNKMENFRISIYSQFANALPDSAAISSSVESMSYIYSEINLLGVSHNLYMLNLCTADQKAKLKKKYEEIVNDMKAEQKEESEEKDDD
jgi:Spy/CpxP family protein refolding chaperone